MALWWVNLGSGYKVQRANSLLWAPDRLKLKDGSLARPCWHWQTMTAVRAGDTFVAYHGKQIVGLATADASAEAGAPKPLHLDPPNRWHDVGWLLRVTFVFANAPFDLGLVSEGLFVSDPLHRPVKLLASGTPEVKQIYLAEVAPEDADTLLARIDSKMSLDGVSLVEVLARKRPINGTTREAITQSRVGQGPFRRDLLTIWGKKCCATGSQVEKLIRASHIKPWSTSNDDERLDPYNGLPLVPAYDAAFDRHMITLSDDGIWENVAGLPDAELKKLGLADLGEAKVSLIDDRHRPYLREHRRTAYQKFSVKAE